MARHLFPLNELIIAVPNTGPRLGGAALMPHGVVLELFSDAACTIPLDARTADDTAPISSVTVSGVTIPPFLGPDDDDVTVVYARPAAGEEGSTDPGFPLYVAEVGAGAGNVEWTSISGKPAVVAAGATKQEARRAIDAGVAFVAWGQDGDARVEEFGIPRRFPFPVELGEYWDLESTLDVDAGNVEVMLYSGDPRIPAEWEELFAVPATIVAGGTDKRLGTLVLEAPLPVVDARVPVWPKVITASAPITPEPATPTFTAGAPAVGYDLTTGGGQASYTVDLPGGADAHPGKLAFIAVGTLTTAPVDIAGWSKYGSGTLKDAAGSMTVTVFYRLLPQSYPATVAVSFGGTNTVAECYPWIVDGVETAQPFDPEFGLVGDVAPADDVIDAGGEFEVVDAAIATNSASDDTTTADDELVFYVTATRWSGGVVGTLTATGLTEDSDTITARTGAVTNVGLHVGHKVAPTAGLVDGPDYTNSAGANLRWLRLRFALKGSGPSDVLSGGADLTLTGYVRNVSE